MFWYIFIHVFLLGSSDKTIKFWKRNCPGDSLGDQHNVNQIENETERIEALMNIKRAGTQKKVTMISLV